jgi:hypothetical protein
VRQGGVLLASYTYNAAGQRSRKTLTAQGAAALGLPATPLTIVFHYDLSGNLLAETSSSGTPIRTYVWREAASGPLAETLLDHPVAQIEHANNVALGGSNGTAIEAVLYLRTDELATPREARNAAGTVVWSWYGAAFGDTSAAEDPDGNGQRTIVNLRFPGQYADQEAGLTLLPSCRTDSTLAATESRKMQPTSQRPGLGRTPMSSQRRIADTPADLTVGAQRGGWRVVAYPDGAVGEAIAFRCQQFRFLARRASSSDRPSSLLGIGAIGESRRPTLRR